MLCLTGLSCWDAVGKGPESLRGGLNFSVEGLDVQVSVLFLLWLLLHALSLFSRFVFFMIPVAGMIRKRGSDWKCRNPASDRSIWRAAMRLGTAILAIFN